MSLWDALRMNMMISYQELVRTFLRCRAISAQFVSSDLIALFELKIDEGQVKLIEERHYKLVPVKELDSSDISNYRMSV